MTTIDPALNHYLHVVKQLKKSFPTPHKGQIACGKAIFTQNKKGLFIQCGRKWGKTEFATYVLWRIAAMYPGVPCYYIAPFAKQAKEILWADPRIKTFGPREWLLDGSRGINESELRLRFKNGSFIKLDGSDNYDAYRGPRFKVVVYEEYKDHHPEFRNAMRPNASVLDGIEVFIGTPPEDADENDVENEFIATRAEHIGSENRFYYEGPSSENPFINCEWLNEEKRRLAERDELDVWMREYEGKLIKGGASKIFPMLKRDVIQPHETILKEIERDHKKLQWVLCADPGTVTVFGVLFAALNPYKKHWYILGEIYEDNKSETSVSKIGRRVFQIRDAITHNRYEWDQLYDEAAVWFQNEMMDLFDENFVPSHKSLKKKDHGLSIIKDVLLQGKVTISSECVNFYKELDNYRTDKNGKIPKENDHLIDCWRYMINSTYYELNEKDEPLPDFADPMFRGRKMEDDFEDLKPW